MLEFIVEFVHLMPQNFSESAFGGHQPSEFSWTIEKEPFSTFGYSLMRNNVFSLCEKADNERMRDSIINCDAPLEPPKDAYIELLNRFRNKLSVLNPDQQCAVARGILADKSSFYLRYKP